jgi:hypothetical protein
MTLCAFASLREIGFESRAKTQRRKNKSKKHMRIRLHDCIGPNGETREWLILASIRAGGFPHVAAQAYGVPLKRFHRLMQLGRIARSVLEASARARLKAEMETYEADGRFWLRHGLGKETSEAPGWSALPKPVYEPGHEAGELLGSLEFQNCVTRLLTTLETMPDARALAAAAFDPARKS